jgi:hypothetical protein
MFKLFKKTSLNSIPFFQGTRKDFHKYFSSFGRNLVQKMTKSYKNSIGKCQHCEVSNVQLDAAHLIGKERKEIIDLILNNFEVDGIIKINLQEFENNFIDAHNPINKTIKILCKKCHLDYDNNNLKISENNIHKTSPTSYEASRLLFKKNIIELLDWDQTFAVRIKDKNEEFVFTKKQFYDTFDNVVNSDSYKLNGNYSYSKTPSKAYKFLKQNKSSISSELNIESLIKSKEKEKIGEFVRDRIVKMYKEGIITQNEIINLQDPNYSKRTFNLNFEFFRKSTRDKTDKLGYVRYYKNEVIPGYWMCSQWYANQKKIFITWENSIRNK